MKHISLTKLPLQRVSHEQEIYKQIFLRNGEVPHITAFSRAKIKRGQEIEPHSHQDMYEVFFVLEGAGELEVARKQFKLKQGDCICIAPKEIHSFRCTSEEPLALLYFGVAE